jgi:hypothetical protein
MLWTTASNMFFACFSLFITSLYWQNSYYLCSFWPFWRRSDGMSCSTMTFQSLCFDEYYHCILFNFVILQYKHTCFWFFSPIKLCFCLLLESFNFTLESTWCNTIIWLDIPFTILSISTTSIYCFLVVGSSESILSVGVVLKHIAVGRFSIWTIW